MWKALVGLYSLFLIYVGFVYIDWSHLWLYGVAKLLVLVLLIVIQGFIQSNMYKQFLSTEIDSAYNIALKFITAIYGIVMVLLFMLMPVLWGIHNLTLVFLSTLIYLTILGSILYFGVRHEINNNKINNNKIIKK